MDPKETVQALFDAIQKGELDEAKSMLTDDFQFSGPVPDPVNGAIWLGMSASLKAAFPDLDYQFKVEGADGDTVNVSAQLKGTHTEDLNLTPMDMGVIPATNKSFANPREHGQVTVRGDKIAAWAVEPIEGGGLMGILDQLGVKPPET